MNRGTPNTPSTSSTCLRTADGVNPISLPAASKSCFSATVITAKKLSNFTLGRRMYESPRKYAAAVAHYSQYHLAVLGTTPKKHLLQTIHLKLLPVLFSKKTTKPGAPGFY